MIKKFWLIFLLLCSFSLAGDFKYLQFEGDKYFEDKKLYEVLGLKQPAWYEFYKDKRPKIDTKLIKPLLGVLKNFYKAQGFYFANISQKETSTTVIIHIDSNDPVIINKIDSNLDPKYQKLVTFKKGDRFVATTFIKIKKEIKNQLQIDGYCNAQLDTKAYIDLENKITDLKYDLVKNSICKFGEITLHIPKNISKKVIYSRLNFKKGSTYSIKKIKDAYSSISGLEAFNSIQIKPVTRSQRVDLDIKLSPKKKRIRQEIGLGYETNLGPKVIFRWSERNFQGDAKKVEVNFKYSKKEKFVSNTLFWPAFMENPFISGYYLDLKNQFSFSKFEYNKFNEKKISNILHLLKDYYLFSVDTGIGFEKIYINKTGEVCNISDGHFFLFYPFINLILDNRDSKINPKEGIYLSAYFESGFKFLSSDTTYTKFISEARFIKSFDRFTLALKGKFGVINEIEKKLPESKLLFGGGAFSNRAYGYNRLGATDSICEDMGGKTLIDTSMELNYWVWDKFALGLFYDSTMLTLKSFDFDTNFRHALGGGVRYLTPIGLIKFDVGFDIESKKQYAVHFQIGQSF